MIKVKCIYCEKQIEVSDYHGPKDDICLDCSRDIFMQVANEFFEEFSKR